MWNNLNKGKVPGALGLANLFPFCFQFPLKNADR